MVVLSLAATKRVLQPVALRDVIEDVVGGDHGDADLSGES